MNHCSAEHGIEVARVHRVNPHVRNIVIVRVVHAIGTNTDGARITMANTVAIIADVENAVLVSFLVSFLY